jgi:SAP domain-containing ribonucleoprotein
MDYSKLKVTELKELLSSRSLPVSGKKEDLIARLIEHDKSSNDLTDLLPPEEDYDWDTPAKTHSAPQKTAPQPSAKPTPVAPAAAPPVPAPKITPEATTATVTATEDALAIELAKRKRRAERFGIPLNDNAKALERAKRFGGAGKETLKKDVGVQKVTGKRVLDDPAEAEKARKRAERFNSK